MDPYEQQKECGEYHRRQKLRHGRVTITHAEVKAFSDALEEWATQNLHCHDNKCSCNYTHRRGRLVHENRCIGKYIYEMLDNLRDRVADERDKMIAKRSGRRKTKVRFLIRHGTKRPKVSRPWRLALKFRASNAKYLGYKRVVKCKRMSEKRRRDGSKGQEEMFSNHSTDSAVFADAIYPRGDFTTTRFLKRKNSFGKSTNTAGVPSGAAVNTFVARLKSRSFKAKLANNNNRIAQKGHAIFRRSHIRDYEEEERPEMLNIVAPVETGSRINAIASHLHSAYRPLIRRFSAHRPPFRRSQVPKFLPQEQEEQEQEEQQRKQVQRKKPLAKRIIDHRPPFRRSHVPKGAMPFQDMTSDDKFANSVFVNPQKRKNSTSNSFY